MVLKDVVRSDMVCVVGLGYVGLSLAYGAARGGFHVIGIDTSAEKISSVKAGRNPLEHLVGIPHSDMKSLVDAGTLEVSQDIRAGADARLKIICVPTPMFIDRRPDLTMIKAASSLIGQSLSVGDIVANESTVAPGMTRNIIGRILEKESGLIAGHDFALVATPERIDPGNTSLTLSDIPKVIGGIDRASAELARQFYAHFVKQLVLVSSLEAAEATKMLENSYRALNLGLANEFARFCDAVGIDVFEVISAAATKWSFHPHYPGIGVGGPCIPKDPYYLISAGEEAGTPFNTLLNAMLSNERMPYFVYGILKEACASINKEPVESRVAIFGISYKGGVKDCRDSPTIVFNHILERDGMKNVKVYDPLFSSEEIERLGMTPFDPEHESCDIIVIATNHPQFENYQYERVGNLKAIVDGRNILAGRDLSVPVFGVGRLTIPSRTLKKRDVLDGN
jgi:UDP-N-acetyl-D-glucosamine dehydrogenase